MYDKFEEEINQVMENTLKKLSKPEDKPKVMMYQAMIDVMKKYVKSEAEVNADFNEALSYPWKSAARMLKHIAEEAKKICVDGMTFMEDQEVFDEISNYYFKNDKESVLLEIQKAEEKKAREKAAKEKEERLKSEAEEQAKKELANTIEWLTGDDTKKAKLLADKAAEILKKMKSAEKRKETAEKKKAEKAKAAAKAAPVKEETKPSAEEDDELPDFGSDDSDDELPDFEAAESKTPELEASDDDELPDFDAVSEEPVLEKEEKPAPNAEPNSYVAAPVTLKDLDEQLSIFDIFQM